MNLRILFVLSLLLISFNVLTNSRPLIDVELEDGVESFNGFVELPSGDDKKLVDDAAISEKSEPEHAITVSEGGKHKGGHRHGHHHGHHGHHHHGHHGHHHGHHGHHHHGHHGHHHGHHDHHHGHHSHHHHHHHGHHHHRKPGKKHHQPRKPPGKKVPGPAVQADIVVAQDGSGNFRTINTAVAAVGRLRNGRERFTIRMKAGTYNEYVDIPYDMENVTVIGDGIGKTIITGNKYAAANGHTFYTRTFGVFGNGFIAQGITFRNTAGPSLGQAVALMSLSNHSVFYRCSFEGYQDTLYINTGLQFFKECDIYGTVDMIFGDPIAILQHCHIYLRPPRYNVLTIVAQKRESPDSNTGIVIQNSTITTTRELSQLIKNGSTMKIYLGRPWGNYSRTVVINTFLENIDSEGWLEWDANPDLVYYAEFGNSGLGSMTSGRVKWKGFHLIDEHEALRFTVRSFLQGDVWLPATKVPYAFGF